MDKLQAFQVFLAVSEQLSFSKAAEALRLPNARVSNIIQELESHLGTKLLERTTRRVALTREGVSFSDRCRQVLSEVGEVETMFRNEPAHLKGKVRVEMSTGSVRLILPYLSTFTGQYPEITLELSSRDHFVDLLREGVDCAVRSGSSDDPELIEKCLGSVACVNCASPAYLEKYGRPEKIDDLKNHRLVHYTPTFANQTANFEFFSGGRNHQLQVRSTVAVNSVICYTEACSAGLGIAQLPLVGVQRHLKDGTLVEILPEMRPEPYELKLIHHRKRIPRRQAQVFMDWLTEILSSQLRAK